MSEKQTTFAQFSTKAEYIVMYQALEKAIWICLLLEDSNIDIQEAPIKIFKDNQGCNTRMKSDKVNEKLV